MNLSLKQDNKYLFYEVRFFLDILDASKNKDSSYLRTAVTSFTVYPKSISDRLLLSRACFLFNFAAKLQKKTEISPIIFDLITTDYFKGFVNELLILVSSLRM